MELMLCYGSGGSGKSTRFYSAKEQLKEEFCLSVSFQTGIDFDSKAAFWNSFGYKLLDTNLMLNFL